MAYGGVRAAVGVALVATLAVGTSSAATHHKVRPRHKVPRFTIVYQGTGRETFSDQSTVFGDVCTPNPYSTESDTAVLKWKVTWKHVVLRRHDFAVRNGVSTFSAGVLGNLSSQDCDPIMGNLLPPQNSTCGTTWRAAGPVTLLARYFTRAHVKVLIPHSRSALFAFALPAVQAEKSHTTGSQDCSIGDGTNAFTDAGFFTKSLNTAKRAFKRVTEASRLGGSPDPIDCSVPSSPDFQDRCVDKIHFKAKVTMIREP